MEQHNEETLPKLTDHFVMREKPWLAMKKALLAEPEGDQNESQKVMVISGMGGSGKTQLTRKFAREFRNRCVFLAHKTSLSNQSPCRYQYICFIDGSSIETIEADLVAYVRFNARGREHMVLYQALGWFIKTTEWLIIFDNVDKEFDLRPFLPQCDYGSILITTRNKSLGQLSPKSHLELGGMSNEEAVEALLRAASLADSTLSSGDRATAQSIVEELGKLPVAIIQAGCFIHHTKSLPHYLTDLRSSRASLLSRTTPHQQGEYYGNVYAVFETSRREVSDMAQKYLHLLSYFHFTNIPLSMIGLAMKNILSPDPYRYLDRPAEFSRVTGLLTYIFGGIDVEALDNRLLQLQNHSLVEIDRISNQRVLRLHPLVQAWAQDSLKFEDPNTYRDAAVLILSICSRKENTGIHRFILPHIRELSPYWPTLHPNDKGAFAELLWNTSPKSAMELWREVYETVKITPQMDELTNARLLLKLGKGYYHTGPLSQAESVNVEAVEIRSRVLGSRHLSTVKAKAHLAATYFALGRYSDAETIQSDLLKFLRGIQGSWHVDTVTATAELALTIASLGRAAEARPLQEDVIERRSRLLGEEHPDTLTSISQLARTYTHLGQHANAERLKLKVLELRRKVLGDDHIDTVVSSENLAVTYYQQRRYHEARELQEAVLHNCQTIRGLANTQAAQAMTHLASTYYKLSMITEAEDLARRAEELQRQGLSPSHLTYRQTVELLRKIQKRRRLVISCALCFSLANIIFAALRFWYFFRL